MPSAGLWRTTGPGLRGPCQAHSQRTAHEPTGGKRRSPVILARYRHRRRHVYCAGIDTPVSKMTASAESFPTTRGTCPMLVYVHVYTHLCTRSVPSPFAANSRGRTGSEHCSRVEACCLAMGVDVRMDVCADMRDSTRSSGTCRRRCRYRADSAKIEPV